jgi:imidazolonepropionase-like amidohydrolase
MLTRLFSSFTGLCFKYLLIYGLAILLVSCSNDKDRLICIEHVNIVTMTSDSVLADQTLIIRNGIIDTFGSSGKVAIPSEAQIVDGAGKYVMPALADMHVHVFSPDELGAYLNSGIATILEMSSMPMQNDWKASIGNGTLLGPTMYTSAMTFDGDPPLNWMFWPLSDTSQVDKAINWVKENKYDFMKIYGTLNPAVFEKMISSARNAGVPLLGHVPRQFGVERTIASGFSMIAHLEDLAASYFEGMDLKDLDEDKIDELATLIAKYRVPVTTTIHLPFKRIEQYRYMDGMLNTPEAWTMSPAGYTQWIKSNNRQTDQLGNSAFVMEQTVLFNLVLKLAKAIQNKNGILLAGTDATTDAFPGNSLKDELFDLVKAGLTPYESIKTATSNAGLFINKHYPNEKFGQIKKGYRADILLLKKNPLAKVENIFDFEGMFVKGKWYGKESLSATQRSAQKDNGGIKDSLAVIDSLLDSNVGDGLIRLKNLQNRYPDKPLYSEWVLGVKAQKWINRNIDYALQIAKHNATQFGNHFAVYNEIGNIYFREEKYDSASYYFIKALQLAPGNAHSISYLEKLSALENPVDPSIEGSYRVILQNNNGRPFPGHDSLSVSILKNNGKYYIEIGNQKEKLVGGGKNIWVFIDDFFGKAETKLVFNGDSLAGEWKERFGFSGIVWGRKITGKEL